MLKKILQISEEIAVSIFMTVVKNIQPLIYLFIYLFIIFWLLKGVFSRPGYIALIFRIISEL
jgi:hypothetical protein